MLFIIGSFGTQENHLILCATHEGGNKIYLLNKLAWHIGTFQEYENQVVRDKLQFIVPNIKTTYRVFCQ